MALTYSRGEGSKRSDHDHEKVNRGSSDSNAMKEMTLLFAERAADLEMPVVIELNVVGCDWMNV